MACYAIATVRSRVNLRLDQFLGFPGALDALRALLPEHTIAVIERRGVRSLCIADTTGPVNWETDYIIGFTDTEKGMETRTFKPVRYETVMSKATALFNAVLVEILKQQIEANTRVLSQSYVGNTVVMRVEL